MLAWRLLLCRRGCLQSGHKAQRSGGGEAGQQVAHKAAPPLAIALVVGVLDSRGVQCRHHTLGDDRLHLIEGEVPRLLNRQSCLGVVSAQNRGALETLVDLPFAAPPIQSLRCIPNELFIEPLRHDAVIRKRLDLS